MYADATFIHPSYGFVTQTPPSFLPNKTRTMDKEHDIGALGGSDA